MQVQPARVMWARANLFSSHPGGSGGVLTIVLTINLPSGSSHRGGGSCLLRTKENSLSMDTTQPASDPSYCPEAPGQAPAPGRAAGMHQHPGQSFRPDPGGFVLCSPLCFVAQGCLMCPWPTALSSLPLVLFRELVLQTCVQDAPLFCPPLHATLAHGHYRSVCSVASADGHPPGPGCAAHASGQPSTSELQASPPSTLGPCGPLKAMCPDTANRLNIGPTEPFQRGRLIV